MCGINGNSLVWQECEALPGNTAESNGSVWALPSAGHNVISLQHRFVNQSGIFLQSWNVTGKMNVDYDQTTLPVNITVHALSVSESWSWGS